VQVHIGAGEWLGGGPGISVQVGAWFSQAPSPTEKVQENTKYNDDLIAYRTALRDWEAKKEEISEQARADAKAWASKMIGQVNPVNELIQSIIGQYFPANFRDEAWEIEFWQSLFDWERASYVTFPSWWSSDLDARDSTLDPSDFINASWARLYLPIRIGMERIALRWLFGKVVGQQLDKPLEDEFARIDQDLKKYRLATFGADNEIPGLAGECDEYQEKIHCLGRWKEVMPTDGTHVEVIQSATTAADQFSIKELEDAEKLRAALIESQQKDVKLKEKAIGQMTEAASIDVHLKIDGNRS